jgi:hypothetical protein
MRVVEVDRTARVSIAVDLAGAVPKGKDVSEAWIDASVAHRIDLERVDVRMNDECIVSVSGRELKGRPVVNGRVELIAGSISFLPFRSCEGADKRIHFEFDASAEPTGGGGAEDEHRLGRPGVWLGVVNGDSRSAFTIPVTLHDSMPFLLCVSEGKAELRPSLASRTP